MKQFKICAVKLKPKSIYSIDPKNLSVMFHLKSLAGLSHVQKCSLEQVTLDIDFPLSWLQ